MEIRDGGGVLVRQLVLRAGGVQDERKDAIEESGIAIHAGDVAVDGKIAGANTNGLLGRGQKNVHDAGECLLRSFAVTLRVVERVVVARGFVVVLRAFRELGKRVQLARLPRQLRCLAPRAKISEGCLRSVEPALLLVVVEEARRGIELGRFAGDGGASIVKKLFERARLLEQVEVV